MGYAALVLAMLAMPLVNVLQVESCAILALAAFFFGGFDAIRRFRAGAHFGFALRVEQGWLIVPLAFYQLARLVIPGCSVMAGLMYFVLFPVVTLVLAVSLAYVLTASKPEKALSRFVVIGILLVVVTPLWDLGFHPQFYVYNHVFGGVLGPIYDLHLAARPGLFVFRAMTLLWAIVLALVGFRIRHPDRRLLADTVLPILVAILAVGYWFGPQLGINTTSRTIADGLGSMVRTEHFEIYYDARAVPEAEVRRLEDDHEFRYAQMAEELGYDVAGPIRSYIYPTAAVRARLTGAGYTDISPVWLARPQVHVLYESYDRTFAHELAHVFSRQMGIPILHASLRVGLVEGFAVAMEPPIGLPDATDQVAAIRNSPEFDSLYAGQSLASAVAASLSPFGFWTRRGAVSYTTMGSFVRYLLDKYGPGPFRKVYGMASFDSAYGKSLIKLADDWEATLIGRVLPPDVAALAASRFSVLSIFERRCPHDTPHAVRRYWDALDDLTLRDTTDARIAIGDAVNLHPDFPPALSIWAQLELQRDSARAVADRLDHALSVDTAATVYLGLSMGDALAMLGRRDEAMRWYARAEKRQSPFSRTMRATLQLRQRLPDDPKVVAAANASGGREAAIRMLARASSPAARVTGALLAATDFQYEKALDILRRTDSTAVVKAIGARWWAWAAAFAYRIGDLQDAERFRLSAVQAAWLDNDPYEVALLKDFGERIEWARKQ